MKSLDKRRLIKFLRLSAKRLRGEWVLLGGSLLPLLGIGHRTTLDIDIVGVSGKERGQVLELMEIAEGLGLSPESINQAAGHFLRQVENWKACLVVLEKGEKGTIYRPDVNLYVRLKIRRLSETDLSDCMEFVRFAMRSNERIDRIILLKSIKQELRRAQSAAKITRLDRLHAFIKGLNLIVV